MKILQRRLYDVIKNFYINIVQSKMSFRMSFWVSSGVIFCVIQTPLLF